MNEKDKKIEEIIKNTDYEKFLENISVNKSNIVDMVNDMNQNNFDMVKDALIKKNPDGTKKINGFTNKD